MIEFRATVRDLFWRSRFETAASRVLEERPTLVHETPDSILADPSGYQPWYADGRKRYATCSGVAWFHGDHLACVNLLGRTIHVHRFDAALRKLVRVQSIVDPPMLKKPENLCFPPDGSFVALTDMALASCLLFRVDRESHRIEQGHHLALGNPDDRTAHGVGVSRCGGFVAHTTVDRPGVVRVHRVEVGPDGIEARPFQTLVNEHYPLVPKGIDFARDGRRVAICFGPNVSRQKRSARVGRLEIREFDPHRGIAPEPLAVAGPSLGVGAAEDVRFVLDDRFVLLTHQGEDRVILLEVDPGTSRIGASSQTLRNPEARLSFPHGVGVSPDDRWVAITNYGNDSLALYAVVEPPLRAEDPIA